MTNEEWKGLLAVLEQRIAGRAAAASAFVSPRICLDSDGFLDAADDMEKAAQEIRFLGFDLRDIEADRRRLDRCIEDGRQYEPSWQVKMIFSKHQVLVPDASPTSRKE